MPTIETPTGSRMRLGSTELRADFAQLDERVGGHPLVYLDSAATALKPGAVLQAEQDFAGRRTAAVHRGAHTLAGEATEQFEAARASVATFVGAGSDEIVWTANATEAINLVAYAFSNASLGRGGEQAERFRLRAGDEIVVTEQEHHSNLVPWQELAARTGAILRHIPVDAHGSLLMEQAADVIGARTRLVAFTHVSNVLGTIAPVAELVRLAHDADALVLLDACQSAPRLPLDLGALGVDFAAFSGHKMLGPTGIGALYGKRELLAALPPFLTGGSMITTVTLERAEYLPPPQRFEAGTKQVSQAIGLGAAVEYLQGIGMHRIAKWEAELGERLVAGLAGIPGIRVLGPGPGEERLGLVSFEVDGVHAHDVGQLLDERGIAVRVGHHCAQPLHRRLGLVATTRASAYLYNTPEEVDVFLEAVGTVRPFFGLGR